MKSEANLLPVLLPLVASCFASRFPSNLFPICLQLFGVDAGIILRSFSVLFMLFLTLLHNRVRVGAMYQHLFRLFKTNVYKQHWNFGVSFFFHLVYCGFLPRIRIQYVEKPYRTHFHLNPTRIRPKFEASSTKNGFRCKFDRILPLGDSTGTPKRSLL